MRRVNVSGDKGIFSELFATSDYFMDYYSYVVKGKFYRGENEKVEKKKLFVSPE